MDILEPEHIRKSRLLDEEVEQHRNDIRTDKVDMTFGELVNMYKDGELIISPAYQRLIRWDETKMTDFVETLLLGYPFPPIYVAEDSTGRWELVDGLQRVATVL